MTLHEQTFVVVDVETTGLDPLIDQPVEICAARVVDGRIEATYATLVNPGIPIRPDASAIHHLTDELVASGLTPADARAGLGAFIAPGSILVAHNASFDSAFLSRISAAPWLCTMRLAKHLWPAAPNYSNQTLRYYLKATLPALDVQAHRAMPDVLATTALLARGIETYLARGETDDSAALLDFVRAPLRIERMPFGQHKGKALAEVDSDYLRWAINEAQAVRKDADLRASLEAELLSRARAFSTLAADATRPLGR